MHTFPARQVGFFRPVSTWYCLGLAIVYIGIQHSIKEERGYNRMVSYSYFYRVLHLSLAGEQVGGRTLR